jgi:cob(I)alamin adenosyltransferase
MITTKTGDEGESDYFGKRVSKGGKILEAVGTLDELQAVLGLVGLEKLQRDIYEIMGRGEVGEKIERLEQLIEKLEKEVGVRKNFVIFKNEKAVELNWIRTVARRAERRSVVFKNKDILVYLNRLSDYIYLLARRAEEE